MSREAASDGDGKRLLTSDDATAATPPSCRLLKMWLALLGVAAVLLGLGFCVFGASGGPPRAKRVTKDGSDGKEKATRSAPLTIYPALGRGNCIDVSGDRTKAEPSWNQVEVLSNGTSPQCERLCGDTNNCNGFETRMDGHCNLLTDEKFYPSSADDTDGRSCFWRHPFPYNTAFPNEHAPKSIPRIIWGFWQNLPNKNGNVAEELPPFIQLCVSSWRKLNPTWKVYLLNETSKLEWLTQSDLPKMYDEMKVQHRADSIRLALMRKHGGVWLDASIIVLKPMEELLGDDLTKQTFFTIFHQGNEIQEGFKLGVHERRVDITDYVENWFFSATPGMPLFEGAHQCILKYYSAKQDCKARMIYDMDQFSDRQLQELDSLRCHNAYLTTHACIVKTLDEDAGIDRWWHSSQVRKLDTRDTALWWVNKTSMIGLVVGHQKELRDGVMKRGIMKFFGYHTTKALHIAESLIRCGPGTLPQLMLEIGVVTKESCVRKPTGGSLLR